MKPILMLAALAIFQLPMKEATAAEILGLFAHSGKSHFDFFEPLMKELARRGHSVTVVSFFPQKEPMENYTDISLTGTYQLFLNAFNFQDFDIPEVIFGLFPYMNYLYLRSIGLETCEAVLPSKPIQDLVNSGKKYDLVVTEAFNTDCFLGIIHKLQAPYITTSSCDIMSYHNRRFSNPSNTAFQPTVFLGASPVMSFKDRLENTLIEYITRALYYPLFDVPAQRIAEKYLGEVPPLSEISKEALLMLINTHSSLQRVRPLSSNVIEVAGLHIKPEKKLPEDIEKYISESKHGVILFSLGSMLKAETLDATRRNAFLDAFREIPQRVIWKFEKELEDLPENVRIYPWIPQRDILNHTNVKAFIAHGGLLGLTEAIHCGKPLMAIPMFGDQHHNVANAEQLGVAVQLPFSKITKERVLAGLRKILSKEYSEKAQEVSSWFHDRPMSPLDTAVYWTEYVIRHKGAPQLKPIGVDLADYEYHLIDVIFVLALIFTGIILVSYLVIKFVIKRLIGLFKRSRKVKTN